MFARPYTCHECNELEQSSALSSDDIKGHAQAVFMDRVLRLQSLGGHDYQHSIQSLNNVLKGTKVGIHQTHGSVNLSNGHDGVLQMCCKCKVSDYACSVACLCPFARDSVVCVGHCMFSSRDFVFVMTND